MLLCLDLNHHPWSRAADPVAAAAETLAVARAADAAGIDAIWATEDADGWDAFALLGALAGATTRARLGPGVATPYPRHPNLLAAAVATLDRLSGGRAVLGLGRGQPDWDRRGLGIDDDRPLATLAETIALLRQWWAAPHRATSGDGARVAIRDWERTIHPVQAPPPIYLAAAGPRALALAGQTCDGVIFNALTSDQSLAEAIPTVRAAAAGAGRDPAALAFVLRTAAILTDDPGPALERQKTLIALVNALPGMDRLLQTPDFDVPVIIAEVRRRMNSDEVLARGGAFPALRREGNLAAARAAIPTALVERLAIAGPLAHVRARLQTLAALGVTHVSVAPPPTSTSPDAWAALLQTLRDDR